MSIEDIKAGVAVFCVVTLIFFFATKDKEFDNAVVNALIVATQVILMFVAMFLFIFIGVV